MSGYEAFLPRGADLVQTIERRINERTWGQVRHLDVEVQPGQVVVHGQSPTYYVLQLALAAVREVVESAPVRVDIQVGVSDQPDT